MKKPKHKPLISFISFADFIGRAAYKVADLFDIPVFLEYKKIKRNLLMSSNELASYQEKKLREIIRHAYNTVPYYKSLLDSRGIKPSDIKTLSDLEKMPLTKKEDLRRRPLRERISSFFDQSKLIVELTGGSTGKPFPVYFSRKHAKTRIAEWLRIYFLHGLSIFDKTAVVQFYPVEKSLINLMGILRKESVPPDKAISEQLKFLKNIKPQVLEGYPSRLNLLALEAQKSATKLSPKAVFTNSETLFPEVRRRIEKAFSVRPANIYDSWEFGRIAWECPERRGLHINADSLVVEILRKDGSRAAPGEEGEVVITDLNNYAMPLIRYELGDRAKWLGKKCSCGIHFPLLETVSGRSDDYLILPDGTTDSPTPLCATILHHPNVLEFQTIQEKDGSLTVMIVPSSYKNFAKETLLKKLRSVTGMKDIRIKLVSRIRRASSGKLATFISKLNSHARDIDARD